MYTSHKPPKKLILSLLGLLVLLLLPLLVSLLSPQVQAAKRNGTSIVIFEAAWCANCRQINPIVQEVGGQNGLPVTSIDVDFQDAPSQAANYGLSIPSADLPQVYFVNQGRVTLLLDGRQYKFVKPDQVRNQLLMNLQQAQAR